MEWTVTRLNKFNSGKLKAFVDLMVDNKIVIKGWRLIDGARGMFLSCPREKGKDDKYYDTVSFVLEADKSLVENMVIQHYKQTLLADTILVESDKPKSSV